MATFRRVSAGKSVLKLVGANLKDGQNVLVGGWSQASSREALVELAFSRRRWGSAPSVTGNVMEPVPARPFVVAVNQQFRT